MLFGPIANSVLVVIGTLIGVVLGKRIHKNIQEGITKALGLVVLYIGFSSVLSEASTMNVLLSMAIGAFIGEAIDLDGKVVKLGDWLSEKMKGSDTFSKGFVQATLLFSVGSMAVIGGLESGIQHVHTTLLAKGVIDGITAIFFAAENGIGVIFSAVALLIYQGGIAICSGFLAPFLTEACLSQINCVGGLILLSVGFNMLGMCKFKSMNFIPAMVITVIFTLFGI